MVSFKGLGKSCIMVIVVAGVEKFTFKGIQSNLVTYLTEVMKMSTSTAVKIVNIWFGVSYSLPIIAAFLADYFSDRYSTLTISGVLYVSDSEEQQMPIEEKKSLVRLIPIWGMLLVFSIVLQQPVTFFTKQGLGMKRNFGSGFVIPSASLQGAKSITIILLVPVYDKIVTPIFRFITRSKKGITVMQRMGVGLFLSALAMAIAAVIETQRLNISRREPNTGSDQMNIFWLLPQYIIMGMSEVFTIVGMQEFFYSEVPTKLKTLGMALPTGVFGVGSFLSAILISILDKATIGRDGKHSWFSDDEKESHLDKYYWLLTVLSAVSLVCFAVYSRKFYH
ncbi:hypothetical protein MKW94_023700 [Papaver nudicaule]|uniref:Uncharacterized protein n=1 Tax=Papaver nudicaule TaxID=74823 RepID=A0AA42AT22_PAPNU|nr:hypothetical protein [Papaver nudicaule]